MTATELIAQLAELVAKHGDQTVLFAIKDEGAFPIDEPRFDTDGAGDDCFLI